MDIGEKIKHIRKEKKMSQKELADILGVKHPTIAYFESRGNTITIEQCIRIATALGVSAQSLLFDNIDYQETTLNSKEPDNLAIVKYKEIEDLRKENEKLKLEVNYERLIRTSQEDRINALCWGYITKFTTKYIQPRYMLKNWNSIFFQDIINKIIPNDKVVANFVKINKELLDAQREQYKKDMATRAIYPYDVFILERIIIGTNKNDQEKHNKFIFQEVERKINNTLENEEFLEEFLSAMYENEKMGYLSFCLEQKIVSDMNILNMDKSIKKIRNEFKEKRDRDFSKYGYMKSNIQLNKISDIGVLMRNKYMNDLIKELSTYLIPGNVSEDNIDEYMKQILDSTRRVPKS